MKYKLLKRDAKIDYYAKQIFDLNNKIFLVESNHTIQQKDILQVSGECYDIKNNSFYVMTIIDKLTNTITISYGLFSYCHSVYYYTDNDRVYLNLSLKELLKDLDITPTINIEKVNEFVKYGFVRGNDCLINEIKKVPALKTCIIKDDKVKFIDSKYDISNSMGDYVDNLRLSLPTSDTKVILPLSGGYDSTLLAYLLKDYDEKIALTAGSLKDKNSEFSNAVNTIRQLNLKHEKVYTTDDWIKALPNIVDIMEGESFDTGMFLTHHLVERIKQLGLIDYTLVTGDGADQLLNVNFYTEDLDKTPNDRRLYDAFFPRFPKHCLYYIIVKKIEWQLRQAGINYIMPFMSDEFYDYAKQVSHTTTKEEYKTFVREFVPDEISNVLRKKGGLVYTKYFLNDHIKNIFLEILHLPKYEKLFTVSNSDDDNYGNIVYRMYIVLFIYIFIENKSIDKDFETILSDIIEKGKE